MRSREPLVAMSVKAAGSVPRCVVLSASQRPTVVHDTSAYHERDRRGDQLGRVPTAGARRPRHNHVRRAVRRLPRDRRPRPAHFRYGSSVAEAWLHAARLSARSRLVARRPTAVTARRRGACRSSCRASRRQYTQRCGRRPARSPGPGSTRTGRSATGRQECRRSSRTALSRPCPSER